MDILTKYGAVAGALALAGAGLFVAHARSVAKGVKTVSFTPSVEVFWVDTAGNLAIRGATAVVPGKPTADAKLEPACRAAAEKNGDGVLTVCMQKDIGLAIKKQVEAP